MTPRPADSDAPTIYLVDGWGSFRRSLRLFLEASGLRVAGEANTIDRAAELQDLHAADVVVVEPRPTWKDLERDLTTIQLTAPAAGVVLLSSEPIPTQVVFQAMQAGVSAYLTKRDDPAELLRAIEAALSKEFLMFPRRLLERATLRHDELASVDPQRAARAQQLTRRELEILSLAGESYSNRDIAQIMWIDEHTVRFHLANVYRKLNVRSRAEAVDAVRRLELPSWENGEAA
jgi:DNA-binding NarL/FixJ family response regulator